ncbi:hypothetical protein [Paenibacillus graminis]|uniref:hypothetical protein n=1 Tax=Paenibacillus graminis TaxID=189425 RepID=UPI002DBE89CB|nr:hypothetical protein [Paenibacillus graminis]MEC0168206.1 hypothetical protein [Paenibacillus graminis]
MTTRQDSLDVTAWHVARFVSDKTSIRFSTQISPYEGILATRGLGPSRDRTFTG